MFVCWGEWSFQLHKLRHITETTVNIRNMMLYNQNICLIFVKNNYNI